MKSGKNTKKGSVIAGIIILTLAGVILLAVQSREDKRLADEEAQRVEEQSDATQPPEGGNEIRGKLAKYEHNTMEGESYIEISSYGIYILSQSGLTCVYPYYVAPSACWTVSDGKIYFEVSSRYQEGDLDYWADAICVVDLDVDDFGKKGEIIEVPYEQRYVFPLQNISVEDGVLWLYGEETFYQMSLRE